MAAFATVPHASFGLYINVAHSSSSVPRRQCDVVTVLCGKGRAHPGSGWSPGKSWAEAEPSGSHPSFRSWGRAGKDAELGALCSLGTWFKAFWGRIERGPVPVQPRDRIQQRVQSARPRARETARHCHCPCHLFPPVSEAYPSSLSQTPPSCPSPFALLPASAHGHRPKSQPPQAAVPTTSTPRLPQQTFASRPSGTGKPGIQVPAAWTSGS